jgi:hypothetical protein
MSSTFGRRQTNVLFSFNWLQESYKKDPLLLKNETCSEKCTSRFMLVILYCISEDTKTDNEMHK